MAAVTAGPTSSAGTATAAPFAVTLAPGTQTVTTAFTGDETYNAATDSDPIEIVKEDCTLTYTGDTTGTAGSSATLSAQFGETDASPGDWSGHEVDFTVVASAGTSHHTASTNASGVATAPVALPAGTFSIAVAFAGDDLYNPCRTFADTQVVVQLAATQVTYTGPATATYSDPVTLSGRLETAASPASPVPGRQLSFTLGSMPTGTASPTGPTGSVATAPIAVSQPPGDTLVTTAFAGDAAYAAATDSDPVRVLKEDCTLAYTGDTLVSPATATTLRAQFGENDTSPGDWSGHALQFVVVDAAMATTSYPATTTTTGAAAISVPLPANVYAVRVTFAGDALYNGCGTVTDTLFTVEQASAKVTGGGWVSNSIGRTSFGLNLIPQAGGLFTSQFQVRTADKSSFHGSGAATPTVLAPSSVRWTGTGRWNGATGYGYVVTTTDNGSSGSKKADLIAIVIYRLGDPGHPVLDTGSQPLKGGNLTVH
jgi:hypothetical protein